MENKTEAVVRARGWTFRVNPPDHAGRGAGWLGGLELSRS